MHHCVQDISAAMVKPPGKASRVHTSLCGVRGQLHICLRVRSATGQLYVSVVLFDPCSETSYEAVNHGDVTQDAKDACSDEATNLPLLLTNQSYCNFFISYQVRSYILLVEAFTEER